MGPPSLGGTQSSGSGVQVLVTQEKPSPEGHWWASPNITHTSPSLHLCDENWVLFHHRRHRESEGDQAWWRLPRPGGCSAQVSLLAPNPGSFCPNHRHPGSGGQLCRGTLAFALLPYSLLFPSLRKLPHSHLHNFSHQILTWGHLWTSHWSKCWDTDPCPLGADG